MGHTWGTGDPQSPSRTCSSSGSSHIWGSGGFGAKCGAGAPAGHWGPPDPRPTGVPALHRWCQHGGGPTLVGGSRAHTGGPSPALMGSQLHPHIVHPIDLPGAPQTQIVYPTDLSGTPWTHHVPRGESVNPKTRPCIPRMCCGPHGFIVHPKNASWSPRQSHAPTDPLWAP